VQSVAVLPLPFGLTPPDHQITRLFWDRLSRARTKSRGRARESTIFSDSRTRPNGGKMG
jgi:hypothetical protein